MAWWSSDLFVLLQSSFSELIAKEKGKVLKRYFYGPNHVFLKRLQLSFVRQRTGTFAILSCMLIYTRMLQRLLSKKKIATSLWCLKITEKVSFYNIASEASYVYIKNLKWSIWRFFEKLDLWVKQRYQTGQLKH